MLVQRHDSGDRVERQGRALGEEAGAMEVVPRLPAHLAEQALALKACPRVRSMAPPHDLLWEGLAYGLGPLSTRRLGAWAVLGGAPSFPKLPGVSASARVAHGGAGS
jgi:hypothetical protein